MDSRVTVFLIVMLLAALRGLMQRSKVRREIEERNAQIVTPLRARRLKNRIGPVVDSELAAERGMPDDGISCEDSDAEPDDADNTQR